MKAKKKKYGSLLRLLIKRGVISPEHGRLSMMKTSKAAATIRVIATQLEHNHPQDELTPLLLRMAEGKLMDEIRRLRNRLKTPPKPTTGVKKI